MKKVLKYIGCTFAGIIILVYLAFLIAPYFIDLTPYKADIQKLVKENSKLNLDYSSLKLYSTPVLSVGVEIKDINVFYDDKTSLLKTGRVKGGIALPSLLTLTAKTSRIYIDNPQINLDIINSSQYKIAALVETILNEQLQKKVLTQDEVKPENKFITSILKKIRIKVPMVKITDYGVSIPDLKTGHNIKLTGDDLYLSYNSARNRFGIKTVAKVLSDGNENILFDGAISLPTPEISLVNDKPKEKADPDEKIIIPFVNLVSIYQNYDFKANVKTRLKAVQNDNKQYFARGYLNADNLSLKLSHHKLPDSCLHVKFHHNNADFDTNIYTAVNEKLSLAGNLKYGKRNAIKVFVAADEIRFSNLLSLTKGLLDSLNIKNDLAQIKTTGFLSANAEIKTNFKKLVSNGYIKVKDGSFIHSSIGLGIKDINANLNFDDNALKIQNTGAVINNSKVNLEGFIDSKSNAQIKLNTQNLSLPALYLTFAPREIKKQIDLKSADLSFDCTIQGKLKDLSAKISTTLSNLSLTDTKKTFFLTNNSANFVLNADKETLGAKLTDNNFVFNMPSVNLKTNISKVDINIDKNNIIVNPFDIIYNTSSKLTASGQILNYASKADIDLFLDGFLAASNISQTLGREISYYIPSKGSLPLKVSIKGNNKEQNIIAQIFSNSENYISPINLSDVYNQNSIIQSDIQIKGSKIKLKDTGLYKKSTSGFSDNLKQNLQGAKQLVELSAILDGNQLNLLRISIPQELKGNIAVFKKSQFKTKGKLVARGKLDDLEYKGDLRIYDINIPEILTSVKDVNLNLSSKNLKLSTQNINLNDSVINASLKADLEPSSIFKISDLNVSSQLIDVDKTLQILDKLNNYMPPQTSTPKKTAQTPAQNIPVSLEGKFNIKKIKTGLIEIFNSKGNILVNNNNLLIQKLSCEGFDGDISGDIGINLISQLITINLNGSKINADKLMRQAVNMKDTISGTLAFNTNISLKGADYQEQMKSLKGNLDFSMVDGQYGPFAKLENFFLAENIRENPFFKNTIGVILTPITTIDSSHFEKLQGKLTFKNGIVTLAPITSQGDILCILIKGDMNLLSNNIDSYVRVRLASAVSDMLGPLSVANPVNLVKNTPGLNIGTAKLFAFFTQVVKESDYKEIPDFSANHSDNNATKFQIVLKGDVAKPLKLVKSFKWLALQEDVDKANEFSDKYIKEQQDLARQALAQKLQEEYEKNNKLKVGVEKVLQMNTTAPAVKDMILEDVVNLVKEKGSGIVPVSQKVQNSAQQVQDKIQQAQSKLQEAQSKILDAQNKLQNLQPNTTQTKE